MKKFTCLSAITGIAFALAFSGGNVLAQGGGGFGGGGGGGGGGGFGGGDPAAMAQQQADGMRQSLSVTNDDEWNVISPRLSKVIQLQGEVRMAGIANMMRSRMGGRGGGGMRGMAAFLGEPDPASTALTKALDENAPIAEVKAAMSQVRESRKKKLDEMAKAQAALKEVVSIRQEAVLLNNGMLD